MDRNTINNLCISCGYAHEPLFQVGNLCVGREIVFEVLSFDSRKPKELKLKCVALAKRWKEFNRSYKGFEIDKEYSFVFNENETKCWWSSPKDLPWHSIDLCGKIYQI